MICFFIKCPSLRLRVFLWSYIKLTNNTWSKSSKYSLSLIIGFSDCFIFRLFVSSRYPGVSSISFNLFASFSFFFRILLSSEVSRFRDFLSCDFFELLSAFLRSDFSDLEFSRRFSRCFRFLRSCEVSLFFSYFR